MVLFTVSFYDRYFFLHQKVLNNLQEFNTTLLLIGEGLKQRWAVQLHWVCSLWIRENLLKGKLWETWVLSCNGACMAETFEINNHFLVVSDAKNMYRKWVSCSLIVKISLAPNFPVTWLPVKTTVFELNSNLLFIEFHPFSLTWTAWNWVVEKPLTIKVNGERGVKKLKEWEAPSNWKRAD